MKWIINADDFGKNKEVNQAIGEAFEKKILTQTTLMVNMPYADKAVEQAKKAGLTDRIGLHLNLTEGKPLTEDIRRLPEFCDENGKFHAKFHQHTLSRLVLSPKAISAVRREADAQIRKYLSYELTLRHMDSHHHVHTDAPVLQALKPLIFRHGMRSVRISRNLLPESQSVVNLYKRFYKELYNKSFERLEIKRTDYFGSFEDIKTYGRQQLPAEAVIEIMLHPMYSKEGYLTDSQTSMREVEEYLQGIEHAVFLHYGEL